MILSLETTLFDNTGLIYSGWVFPGLLPDGGGPPLPKIYDASSTMMKLGTVIAYLKEIQKYINHVKHPLSSADISNLLPEIRKFCYIKKYMYRLHFDTKLPILLNFLGSLKIVFDKKVRILMMSAKVATPGLLKIKIF